MWSYLSLFFLHLCMRKICILLYQKHILFEITHFTQCNAQKYIFFNQNIPWTPKTKFLMEAWHGCFFGGKATCLGKKCQAKCNISKIKPEDKKSVVKLWPFFFFQRNQVNFCPNYSLDLNNLFLCINMKVSFFFLLQICANSYFVEFWRSYKMEVCILAEFSEFSFTWMQYYIIKNWEW